MGGTAMKMNRLGKGIETHAWILLFVIGVINLLSALPLLLGIEPDATTAERIIGMTFSELKASDPRLFDLVTFCLRSGGLFFFGFGLLSTAISVTAYRRREKWAWYTLWILPAYFLGSTALVFSIGPTLFELVALMLFVILSLLGLLLPYRKFFPGK